MKERFDDNSSILSSSTLRAHTSFSGPDGNVDDSKDESSSVYSSTLSSTTIAAHGNRSELSLNKFGEVVSDGVDNVVAWAQLSRIESSFKKKQKWHSFEAQPRVKEMCGLLLKFSHPEYLFVVRTRALQLIMAIIGSTSFMGLVEAFLEFQSPEVAGKHVRDIVSCILVMERKDYRESVIPPTGHQRKKLLSYYKIAYESYTESLVFPGTGTRSFFTLPIVLYLAFITSRGTPEHARIISAEPSVHEYLAFVDKEAAAAGGESYSSLPTSPGAGAQLLRQKLACKLEEDPFSIETMKKYALGSKHPLPSDYFWTLRGKRGRFLQKAIVSMRSGADYSIIQEEDQEDPCFYPYHTITLTF
ncbi:hypothetical protein AAF712_012640 [Marasmius tenuissimus]|uniref:Uncharacterized protein n=1 Tax=Marasmius tenuissimus TaxID=585030 RepID=A0ABR2ZJF5_9AGAR